MSSPKPAANILIIRLSAIGDTIHCLPVAAALKRRIPGAQITWLVEPASRPLLENNPAVDRVLVLDKKSWLASLSNPSRWAGAAKSFTALVAEMKSARFDLTLDLQGLLKSSLWTMVSSAPVKVGFATAREGAPFFFTDRLEEDYFRRDRHVVETNLLAVDYICHKLGIAYSDSASSTAEGAVEFPLPEPPEDSIKRIRNLLANGQPSPAEPNVSMVRNVVLIPGTTWQSKVWDWQSWARLGQLIARQPGWRVCLTGGASERPVNQQIAEAISAGGASEAFVDLTGQTSLLDLIALFRQTDLVVGADTGPLHLAAAVGTPQVIAVHGSTPTIRNGPYGRQCRTISLGLSCQPCFKKKCPLGTLACLKDLTAESVFAQLGLTLS
jgi:heptosyltransferase-1